MEKPIPQDLLLEIDEIIPLLNKISIFGALNDKQLYVIFNLLKRIEYKKGDMVFEQGDAPSHIFIILSGCVELVLNTGKSFLVKARFEEGACFGETAVLGIQKHTAGAVAVEDSKLIVLSKKALFSIWETDKELFALLILNIAREACRRLSQSEETLLHYFSEKS